MVTLSGLPGLSRKSIEAGVFTTVEGAMRGLRDNGAAAASGPEGAINVPLESLPGETELFQGMEPVPSEGSETYSDFRESGETAFQQGLPQEERIERTVRCTICDWYTPGVPQKELIEVKLKLALALELLRAAYSLLSDGKEG